MRLMEYGYGQLPQRAGEAKLEFARAVGMPTRKEDLIQLDFDPKFEFFPLKKGEQFLFVGIGVWFGGTDENPFLVRLKDEVFSRFLLDGEEGFYDQLKPARIKLLEKRTCTIAKRQGDFFAFPMLQGWKTFDIASNCIADSEFPGPKDCAAKKLFGTRHLLTGQAILLLHGTSCVAEGVLKAPDHEDLVMEGVHYVSQANLLWSPPDAD